MKKIYLIAAVIALAAGVATYFFASELKTSKIVTGVDEATVLIAVDDINENTVLTKDMFQVTKLPMNAVPFGSVTNINDIVGYMSTDNILAGETLVVRKITLVGDQSSDGRLSYQLKEGMYAYTISVAIDNAVAYFIKEDDRINIYAPMSSEPVLENIPVLKIGDYTANSQQNAGTEMMSYTVVTLALTKEQIPKMLGVDNADDGNTNTAFRIVLVSYEEGHGLTDDIEKASVPESRSPVPQTNYGMGEITTSPPTTE